MLNIWVGHHENEVYASPIYFDSWYEDSWLTTDFAKDAIKDIDNSVVVGPNLIESAFFGPITPLMLSGGVKTVLCAMYDMEPNNWHNASMGGDNTAYWYWKGAQEKDVTITLNHLMYFTFPEFKCKILNTGHVVDNMKDFGNVFIALQQGAQNPNIDYPNLSDGSKWKI